MKRRTLLAILFIVAVVVSGASPAYDSILHNSFRSQSSSDFTITLPLSSQTTESDIAVDPWGDSYVAYVTHQHTETGGVTTWTDTYTDTLSIQSNNTLHKKPHQIAESTASFTEGEGVLSSCSGRLISDPSLAINPTGGLQVSYLSRYYSTVNSRCSKTSESIEIVRPTELVTLIPGINDHGSKMVLAAKNVARVNTNHVLTICEARRNKPKEVKAYGPQTCSIVVPRKEADVFTGLSRGNEQKIRSKVDDYFDVVEKHGNDLAVLIDMDLEGYSSDFVLPPKRNRWSRRSVPWAAAVANVVSNEYSKKERSKLGSRILMAHSAGGDAVNMSVERASGKKRMYDFLVILNGRTNADQFRRNLWAHGYKGWQVKVFTNRGDLPAAHNRSLSNWAAVRDRSGPNSWTAFLGSHLTSCGLRQQTRLKCHSAVRNALADGGSGDFDVRYGGERYVTSSLIKARVAAMTDWRGLLMGKKAWDE